MSNIKLLAEYPRIDIKENNLAFEAEQEWKDRPAWIRLEKRASLPRFLSIQVPKFGEIIYKSFGKYYYPLSYTNDEERRLMNAMAHEFDEMVGDSYNIPMAKKLLEKIPFAEISEDANVLDLGCGTGIMSEILAEQGYRNLTLVDFSREMLARAKKKASLRTGRFFEIDLTKELPPGHFDLAVSVMLFNTFDKAKTEAIIEGLVKKMNKNAILGILEDTGKPVYSEHFDSIFSGMVDVADRTKFIFVGRKK